jgi:hypothetical protein
VDPENQGISNVVPFRQKPPEPRAKDASAVDLQSTLARIFDEALAAPPPESSAAPRLHRPTRLWDPDTAPWIAVLDELFLKLATSGAEIERWAFTRSGIDRRAAICTSGELRVQTSHHALATASLAFRELVARSGLVSHDNHELRAIDVVWGCTCHRWAVELPVGCDPNAPRFPLTVALHPLQQAPPTSP